jgi:heptosyltransferase-2
MSVRGRLPATVTDIVWLQTSFLGDIVLTTAAVKAAAAHFPAARQHIVTTRLGVAALADFPALASRVAFDKGQDGTLAAFKKVRDELAPRLVSARGTVVLRAHRSFRSSLLATFLGWPSVAYREGDLSWLARVRVPRVAVLHEAQRIGLLLEPLGVPRQAIVAAQPALTALPLLPGVPWQADLAARAAPWIGIAPGSVWGTKRWTIEGFIALAEKVVERGDGTLVLLGSDKERPLTEQIEAALARRFPATAPRWLNVAGMTDLDDLRRVMPRLSLLVANDSSPIHYASAFDVPTVALFGATVPQMGFGPLARGSVALGVELDCRPCSDHGPQVCPLGHFKCMRTLASERVYAEVERRLAEPAGRSPTA